ncbi:MAG: hypothetical protein LJE68_16300, partial [Rhodobacter sp.]|nr:hypothetical protein [Rhodobacter sp.]
YAAVSDVTITDFEPGIDTMLIEGVDLGLYLSSSATVISGNETVTVLALDTGDSITLDGLALSDFNDFYFGVG